MQLTVFLLFIIFHVAHFAAITTIEELCANDKPCYGFPENCNMDDCSVILSFRKGYMDFLFRDTDFSIVIGFHSEKNGVLDSVYLVCFPGTSKCFLGDPTVDEAFKIKNKIDVEMTELDEINGDFLYSIPHVIFETGPGMTYFAAKNKVITNFKVQNGRPMHLISGNAPTTNLKTESPDTGAKPLSDLFVRYEQQMDESDDRQG
ncbi:unnamed protein product [Caenorhabditis bovis]|uniref:DOMON domain-containing protein n=1 Tax=Caenorhabditis bovis TaxID=2654633 RepID=A0A8S1EML6_9PELO|nr:unnamed protein product [Caenorhabditis bovis]